MAKAEHRGGTPTRVQSQARSTATHIYTVAAEVWKSRKPADRLLAAHFRRHRKLGAQDRRLISETFFALFRWWGWLRQLARDETSMWQRDPKRAAESIEWQSMLLGAHLLDVTALHPVAAVWKQRVAERRRIPSYLECFGGLPLEKAVAGMRDVFALDLAVDQLLPDWISDELPDAPDGLQTAMQRRPPLWLRARTDIATAVAALEEEGISVEPHAHIPAALKLAPTRINLYELESYTRGLFEVQDLASQVIGLVCSPAPGQRWWDACAGAGGKTLQLAGLMHEKGLVLATDIRAYKLEDLRKRARRAKLSNIQAKPWNGRELPGKAESFHGVLVDAPCTCSGTWRRNPDARWTMSRKDIDEAVATQSEILERVAGAVRPKGALVYATCSLFPRENQAVVQTFLDSHPDFSLEAIPHPLNQTASNGMVTVWPMDGDCDAMFAARLRRTGG